MNRETAKSIILETCGKGWLSLVDEIYDSLPNRSKVTDVYQKWGMLTVKYEPSTREFDGFLERIQAKSEFVCEICGERGSHYVIDQSLEAARCKKHSEGGVDLFDLPKKTNC